MVIFNRAKALKDRNHSNCQENKLADPENSRLLIIPEENNRRINFDSVSKELKTLKYM